ncbi:unnamed protein product [Dibothriocephalus latus]|uniref:Potassium channel domain-containing protein n=1 Tax=Dibothriocephalus latus TaxID=60516 RepID=A0A3P7N0G3_DIBLA|nr:unnamed protein product [Dibothriocephalus latus]
MAVIVGYVALGTYLFRVWETDWTVIDGAYFSVITISTIGFGDLVPGKGRYEKVNRRLSQEPAYNSACRAPFYGIPIGFVRTPNVRRVKELVRVYIYVQYGSEFVQHADFCEILVHNCYSALSRVEIPIIL